MGRTDILTGAVRQFPSGEQLPEDGLVRPKHVATECDFNGNLK
jgi:hypothetical protein